MDRRQRKTRQAIFSAFAELLSLKKYSVITVGDIIKKADVGRSTFYSHFDTKDYLLKEYCRELFCHLFDTLTDNVSGHKHIFDWKNEGSVFGHLLHHLDRNDNNICKLLTCNNNELFLDYFKNELKKLLKTQKDVLELAKQKDIPEEFWINHVSCCFVETVKWWFAKKKETEPEKIITYFLRALGMG